jgi:phage terminase Nu1 subunit (DNA packaging protein)
VRKLAVVVACGKKQGGMAANNGDSCLRKIITLADLSALVVVSERTIQRLAKEGVIPLAKNKRGQPMRGKFVLGEAVPRFIENLRDRFVETDPTKAAFNHDRARKMKIEADSAQMDLEEKRGVLVRVSDVEFEIHQTIRNVRDGVRAVPSRIMHSLVGLKDPREANKIVAEAIDATSHRVADGEIIDVKRWRKENSAYLREQGFPDATVTEILDEQERRRERNIKQRRAERGV